MCITRIFWVSKMTTKSCGTLLLQCCPKRPVFVTLPQCCGSGWVLTRSRSDFGKGPDPDLNKFSGQFLLEFFLANKCSKTYIHEPKVKQQRFHKILKILHTPKRLKFGQFLSPGSGSDQKCPDPFGSVSGSATLHYRYFTTRVSYIAAEKCGGAL
jgi:hypothetical protein